MAVAKGVTVRPSTQNFRIDADFIDNLGVTITSGTFTAYVSEVQDDGTLRALDFNASPPTVCATAATVPTTATISLTNRTSGNTSRAYWSATFAGTNLTVGGVYLVEFNVPTGVTQPRPKLIQFGAVEGDMVVQTGDSFDRIGAAGAGLTGITTVGAVSGSVGGNVVGSVGSVVGAVGSVTGNVGGNVVGNVNGSVGSVTSKTGFKLASDGVDLVLPETGINLRQAISVIGSVCVGKATGVDTGSPTYKGMDNDVTRVSATAASGNRSAVTLSLPS